MDLNIVRTAGNLSGVPPLAFEEWDGDSVLAAKDDKQSTVANSSQPSHSNNFPVSHSLYNAAEFPSFGPRYGIPARPKGNNLPDQKHLTISRIEVLDPYEEILRKADADIQSSYADQQKPCGDLGVEGGFDTLFNRMQISTPPEITGENTHQRFSDPISASPPFESSQPPSTGCIICTEQFSGTVAPPAWISQACLHNPSVCCECLAKCIQNDLETKIWNQIKCPECRTLLIYEDIKRLADPVTFSRYEVLSFRSAVNSDANFVWCQNCDFGQLHDSGMAQPIIRCLNCGFRSCFRHSVPWHDRLTCEEYDEMLQNPDGFRSAIDMQDAAAEMAIRLQEQEDEMFARQIDQRDKRAEQERQKQRHEEERRRARAAQKAAAEKAKVEQDRARKMEALKRRAMEEKLSVKKVHATTKPCPGCRWPIEKNAGCSHMTCTQCGHHFCWNCMANWLGHGSRCPS